MHAALIEVPDDFPTIQAAVDAAVAGDIITVAPGIYTENIELIDNIELRGEETSRTILRPASADPIVQASGISNTIIRNFTFADGDVGVGVANGFNIGVRNNVFDVGSSGIGVDIGTLDSTVDVLNNTFFGNATAIGGVSDLATVENNIFAFNDEHLAAGIDEDRVAFNCFSEEPLGFNAVVGDPGFVDIAERDFHLRAGSPCVDIGRGIDVIDDSIADAGAFGGEFADPRPFPVSQPDATVIPTDMPSVFNIQVDWEPSLSYAIDGYRLYYDSDESGPPYDGTDAENEFGMAIPSPVNIDPAVTSYTLYNLDADAAVPDAPVLEVAEPGNRSIDLRWSPVSNADGYRIHYGVSSLDENRIDVDNVTAFEISGLENGVMYLVAVAALNRATYYVAVTVVDIDAPPPNESIFSEEVAITLGEAQESPPSNELTAVPQTIEPFPDLPDQGDTDCFIATAAYGHYSKPQVQVLRDFRDAYLMHHSAGRTFVRWYYAWSPEPAAFIAERPEFRTLAASALLPLVGLAYFMVHISLMAQIATPVCCLAIVALLFFRKQSSLSESACNEHSCHDK